MTDLKALIERLRVHLQVRAGRCVPGCIHCQAADALEAISTAYQMLANKAKNGIAELATAKTDATVENLELRAELTEYLEKCKELKAEGELIMAAAEAKHDEAVAYGKAAREVAIEVFQLQEEGGGSPAYRNEYAVNWVDDQIDAKLKEREAVRA